MSVGRFNRLKISFFFDKQADWTIAACADAGANCFIAGSGMFAYDDLSVGCHELRTIAEAAQKGQVLPKGEMIAWLEEQKATA